METVLEVFRLSQQLIKAWNAACRGRVPNDLAIDGDGICTVARSQRAEQLYTSTYAEIGTWMGHKAVCYVPLNLMVAVAPHVDEVCAECPEYD